MKNKITALAKKLWGRAEVRAVVQGFVHAFVATFAAGFLGVFALIQKGNYSALHDAAFALVTASLLAGIHASQVAIRAALKKRAVQT